MGRHVFSTCLSFHGLYWFLSSLDLENSHFAFKSQFVFFYTVRHVLWLPITTVLVPSILFESIIIVALRKQKIPQEPDYPWYIWPSIGEDLPEEEEEPEMASGGRSQVLEMRGECWCWNGHVPHTPTSPSLRAIRWSTCKRCALANIYTMTSQNLSKPQAHAFKEARLSCNPLRVQHPIRRQEVDYRLHFQSSEKKKNPGMWNTKRDADSVTTLYQK